jgi:hypothetical protein
MITELRSGLPGNPEQSPLNPLQSSDIHVQVPTAHFLHCKTKRPSRKTAITECDRLFQSLGTPAHVVLPVPILRQPGEFVFNGRGV